MISLLYFPLLACIALVLIHVYFGAFILRRGILFIDLALAQWAALGYLVGQWMGVHNPYCLFLFGFGFTIIASFLLIVLKPLYNKINLQEAVIGVIYIIATATATGIISSTGMEGHHLKTMLSGHLLFVQPSELILTYTLYTIIAILLFWLHKYFLSSQAIHWNFIFYLLFGAIVTSSVKMVGILLVFSYLVLPLLSTILFTNKMEKQLKFSWLIGILASILGLFLSMKLDIPPTYCIILVLSCVWFISVSFKFLMIMGLSQFVDKSAIRSK